MEITTNFGNPFIHTKLSITLLHKAVKFKVYTICVILYIHMQYKFIKIFLNSKILNLSHGSMIKGLSPHQNQDSW